MKISSLKTGIVELPNDEPLAGFSENPNATNPIVWLRLGTCLRAASYFLPRVLMR